MAVNPEKQQELNKRLQALGIQKSDVVEQFIRASGPGGQKVNKTSSAVYLKHLPSGIEIKAQKDRSQAINRFLAWRLLADRLEGRQSGEDPQTQAADRIRKQKKRRKRRSEARDQRSEIKKKREVYGNQGKGGNPDY